MTCLNNILINGNVIQIKFHFEESFEAKRGEFLCRYKRLSIKDE
jgi:hypothetical protein